MHRVADPIAILARDSQVLFANRAARRLIARGNGLMIRRGQLGLETPTGFVGLCPSPEEAGSGARAPKLRLHPGTGLLISLQRLPAAKTTREATAPASWLVQFYRSRSSLPQDPGALQAVFGLSPAEATLVVRLCAGDVPKVAARALGRSPNTVKTQLRSVFSKLAVHSQAQLLGLLARTAPLLQD